MSRSCKVVADDVASRARGLDLFVKRMERLRSEGKLSTSDVERAYAGCFLKFHAFSERAIEKLFLGLLTGRLASSDRSVRSLVAVKSDAVAHAVVTGERAYVDWLPYNRFTLGRAKAFFASGKPFTDMNKTDIDAFEEASMIRNALGHQRSSAIRKFREKFIKGRSISPSQVRPSAYLRGSHTLGQTRMNYFFSRVVVAMHKLCQ